MVAVVVVFPGTCLLYDVIPHGNEMVFYLREYIVTQGFCCRLAISTISRLPCYPGNKASLALLPGYNTVHQIGNAPPTINKPGTYLQGIAILLTTNPCMQASDEFSSISSWRVGDTCLKNSSAGAAQTAASSPSNPNDWQADEATERQDSSVVSCFVSFSVNFSCVAPYPSTTTAYFKIAKKLRNPRLGGLFEVNRKRRRDGRATQSGVGGCLCTGGFTQTSLYF
ncbi:hypothetical protein FN846DRAFT_1024636 [Sphaerosporella brunnea]|uniref:Uncharacterized protein n=1 Tax=Sphaerosporella brunnea TaxID=1250544 RepID=A0A5J5EHH0_9PEZI|nr:hypothetical protein FN846DRAFT_1024636 [Sphaerosporella brunnea]